MTLAQWIAANELVKNLVVLDSNSERIDIKCQDGTAIFEKQILKRGVFKAPPPNETVDVDFNDEFFDALIDAFDKKAIDNVPIILGTHDEEQTERIVGKVTGLIKKDDGLYMRVEIADDDIVAKIETETEDGKGLIDEVSVGIAFGITTDDGTEFAAVLFHVAIVTHAWYRNMNTFERIAAMFKGTKPLLIKSVNSLEEEATRVRSAFYEIVERIIGKDRWDYTVEGVYSDYIIVYNYIDGNLYRYTYTESDNNIEFAEPIRVVKSFVEAKMDEKELLEALKKLGVEFDSIDALKAAIAEDDDDDDKDKDKDDDTATKAVLAKIGAVLNPGKQEKEVDLSTLATKVTDMSATIAAQDGTIKKLSEELVDNSATNEVDKLVEAGVVVPAKRDHYIALYKQDKDLFASITKNAEPVVKTGQTGANNGTTDNIGGDLDVDKEVARILGKNKKETE